MMRLLRKALSQKADDDQNIDVEETPNLAYDESCRKLSRELDAVIK